MHIIDVLFYYNLTDLKEIVQLLIKNEANIESKDLEGSTPLFLAALHGKWLHWGKKCNFLMDSTQLCIKLKCPYTSLIYHLLGRMEIVRLLIESGANIYDTNNYGHTALQAAIANSDNQQLCCEWKSWFYSFIFFQITGSWPNISVMKVTDAWPTVNKQGIFVASIRRNVITFL